MWLTKGLRARPLGTQFDGSPLVLLVSVLMGVVLLALSTLMESEPVTVGGFVFEEAREVVVPGALVPLGPTPAVGPEPPLGPVVAPLGPVAVPLGPVVVPLEPPGATG